MSAEAGSDAGNEPSVLDCDLGSMRFEASVDALGDRSFALAVGANTGYLLYTVPDCLGANGLPAGFTLRALEVPSGGDFPEPRAVEDQACAFTREPAVVALATGGALGYYARREADSDELYAIELAGAATSVRLSTAGEHDSVASAAGRIESSAWVAWAARKPGELATEVVLYRGSSRASRRVLLDSGAGQQVKKMALVGLGRGDRERALGLLAWVDEAPGKSAIRMQLVDDKGGKVGEPHLLSDQVGSASSVDGVAHESGGALVYTVGTGGTRHEVRMQRIDQNGQLLEPVVKLTSGDQNARDAAIARYATGYAVAYRVLPPDSAQTSVLRIAFLDESGNLAGTRDVSPVARGSEQIRMVLAQDGRLVIAWTDASEGARGLRLVRAVCP